MNLVRIRKFEICRLGVKLPFDYGLDQIQRFLVTTVEVHLRRVDQIDGRNLPKEISRAIHSYKEKCEFEK